jgi:hypothetical protein
MSMIMSMYEHEHEHVMFTYMLMYFAMYLFIFTYINMNMNMDLNKLTNMRLNMHMNIYMNMYMNITRICTLKCTWTCTCLSTCSSSFWMDSVMTFLRPFFHQKTSPGPINMPREDFKFCRIFIEYFVFVIDSPVYSSLGNRTPGCQDSPEYSSLGSWGLPSDKFAKELTKIGLQKNLLVPVQQVVKNPLWWVHKGVLTPQLY